MVQMRQIRDWSRCLAKQFKPERIILFGSYAYGKPREDSDVDLLVVLRHESVAAKAASDIRMALPHDVSIDVIVRSPEKFRERLKMKDFFMRDIAEKGLVLYEARSH
ncbi:MAG: nucleotidyltransferase domain-containing protein [bacterium]|jgi:predicted nucleotidyltransferase